MTEVQDGVSCGEAAPMLWDYVDATTSPEELKKVERHLSFCRACGEEMQFVRALRLLITNETLGIDSDVKARLEDFVDGMVRLSCGLEDAEDLIADLRQVLSILRENGFQARRLEDGFPEWRVEDRPVVRRIPGG
jgi:anti-sigma factor RsiW